MFVVMMIYGKVLFVWLCSHLAIYLPLKSVEVTPSYFTLQILTAAFRLVNRKGQSDMQSDPRSDCEM